ncbi:MAG: COX15/CtaA family protein [Bacteroidetes bacterium]|nr:COX15/CtaA family protein [Bacteroidota bacterium]
MQKLFRILAYATLIGTFLVILAGSVVRTTNSGMGCPDWPRCFGYYIPPTADEQVRYQQGREYRKGMLVIENDTLWRAKSDLIAGAGFERDAWEKYPKHDYSDFVVHQTWIEYINRLLGALLGLVIFALVIASFSWIKSKPLLFVYSFALLLVTGFQAWLGKLVVDGNLIPESISMHMLGSLLMLVLAELIIRDVRTSERPSKIKYLKLFAFIATASVLVQTLIGTQVREEIDTVAKLLGAGMRSSWVDELSSVYLIHRAFSLVAAITCGVTAYLAIQSSHKSLRFFAIALFGFTAIELLAGISLGFAGMPPAMQPVHLLSATVLFWLGFSVSVRKTT